MDLQDLFFSATEGWSKWHLWLGSECLRSGACSAATCGGGKPQNIPAEFTVNTWACTCARSPSAGCLLYPRCLERDFLSGAHVVRERVFPPMNAPVWWGHSRVARIASANKWPHPIISFQSQMSSNKPFISHLFKCTLSPLRQHYATFFFFNLTALESFRCYADL